MLPANSATRIELTWADNANNESAYEIWRAVDGNFELINLVSANTEDYSDTGLAPETEYCYRVRAVNTTGNSDYTSDICATTLAEASNQAPVIAPIADQTLNVDETLEVPISVEDMDGDDINLSLVNAPDFVSIMGNTGSISDTIMLVLAPQLGDAGSYEVTLMASDANGAETQERFNVIRSG